MAMLNKNPKVEEADESELEVSKPRSGPRESRA
jgi:hypothetical protein